MFSAPKTICGSNLFEIFTDELGGIKKVAKFLDVTEITVKRWIKKGAVPRAAVLALYWESKYGRSQLFTDQVNDIRLLYRHVQILQSQYTRAKDIVAGLRRIQVDTANEPYFDELINVGGCIPNKYGTAETALPSLPHSQPLLAVSPMAARA